ncbi:hypothetical protein LPJ64_005370 [Coemansia asiatica]|uniref:CCZ1/INTU/HSP4 first Longin domain-containing protein n=1 Tax=Coemansia asiatica TaxID=1052880 RepID=A0A9W8CHQ6_9FUNG|nr:hypothetical protein LPJ64_005370 [Coemansia asiatica]
MNQSYPAALSHFAVFCPELGPDEDTSHEQLLFYAAAALPPFYPCSPNDYYARNTHLRRRSHGSNPAIATVSGKPSTETTTNSERVVSLDTKLREIGLGSALVSFARTFTDKHEEFHIIRSEKRRTLVFEAEPGVLLQLAVVLPRRVKALANEKDAYTVVFQDHELDDQALKSWLKMEYWSYRILYGPLRRAAVGMNERRMVRRQLDVFFGRTLAKWDARWADELGLVPALAPVPRVPVGAISLGGFDELWRELQSLDEVCDVVVLWKGADVVWSSKERDVDRLRALVAWSRAVFAPVFAEQDKLKTRPLRAAPPRNQLKIKQSQRQKLKQPSSSLSSTTSWLWGWGSSSQTKPQQQQQQQPVASSRASVANSSRHDEDRERDGDRDSGADSDGFSDTMSTATARGIVSSSNGGGGIAQALSRAVNALVEPRPQTPPEVDPALESFEPQLGPEQYTLSAADIEALQIQQQGNSTAGVLRDSDADSLRSVGSLASVRTTATAAVAINRTNVTRARSNTTQTGPLSVAGMLASWQPVRALGIPRHVRTPSIVSNYSAATVDSTRVLRDDTRVSSRSWWPQTWGWGSSGTSEATASPPSVAVTHAEQPLMEAVFEQDTASATEPATTFVFTGEHVFPGIAAPESVSADGAPSQMHRRAWEAEEHDGSSDQDEEETSSQLGTAMDEEMPSVYEHGVNVDIARGVVLAPRALSGMQYDTRLLHQLYGAAMQTGANEQTMFPELALFMGPKDSANADGMCKTFVYRYGQMLYFVFGQSSARLTEDEESTASQKTQLPSMYKRNTKMKKQRKLGAAIGARRGNWQQNVTAQSRFSGEKSLRIEQAVLQYAEQLHAALARDVEEMQVHRVTAAQGIKHRVPPYFYLQSPRATMLTNRPCSYSLMLGRPYLGLVDTGDVSAATAAAAAAAAGGRKVEDDSLSLNARLSLKMVCAELERGRAEVCVRMQNKGWVAGLRSSDALCFCLIDQPKATLADAQTLLTRICNHCNEGY